MNLQTPLKDVLRTTTEHLKILKEMGVERVEELLLYLPRTHDDLRSMQTIAGAPLNEKVTIRGTVDQLKLVFIRGGKKLVTARLMDTEGGVCEVIWFNQPHIKRMLADGDDVVFTGKLVEKGYRLQMISPEFELHTERPLLHAGRIIPIYRQHDKINTKWLREKMVLVKDAIDLLSETLPEEVLKEEKLLGRREAVRALHFPQEPHDVQRAIDRMAFEEMYVVQCEALEKKREWQGEKQERLKVPMDVELIRLFFASLHFTPTDSQKIAIYEILQDLEKDRAMSRLLEGDVGSGKTLVAEAIMANVIAHGGQCALMVPTEVLAKQHIENIGRRYIRFFRCLQDQKREISLKNPPVVALLTGSITKKNAQQLKQGLSAGTIDLVVGTHALIEDPVRFHDLKLVIVDEQHRFGVAQRELIKEKGSPHFLAMTATPIPRTLALTAYGHHDLSVLMEKPGQKQKIHTKVVSPQDRKTVERFIDREIQEGRQVFVICPLIEESENEEMHEIKSVEEEAVRLKESFPQRKIAILHGRMAPKEKEKVMREFRERTFDLLVSTSVIEVGIDIPNVSIMIIEGAERFGLAQLHQFRGRVGRGEQKSYCFLFTTSGKLARSPRLKAMEEHDSGFELAEIDLKIRGPGEFFGLRQSGFPEFRFGGLLNPELVVRARRAAEKYVGASADGRLK